jgi:RHS repeat-associated protein
VGCATVVDPDGNETSYGWDVSDQPVKTIDGLNQVATGIYNPDGQGTSSSDNSGNMSTASYDANHNQLTTQAPPAAAGQSAAMADSVYATSATPAVMGPGGSTIAGNQYLASTGTDPDNNCGTDAYDSNGNVTTQWSGLAATGTGATRTCTTPSGSPTGTQVKATDTYTGDTGATGCTGHNGELCTSTNGNGGVTTYTYNTNGQLTTVTPPSPLHPITITYDANGRRATVTDGAGRVTTYSYDADDRTTVTDINTSDPSCSTAADCVVDYYDPNGNVILQVDGSGTTTKDYNLLDQLTVEYLPGGVTNTCATPHDAGLYYTHDPAGNLASYCDQSGTVSYVYDADNHNTGVADPGGSCTPGAVTQPCTTFTYSPTGKRTGVAYPTTTGVTATIGYDNAGNETSILTKKAATTLVNLTYSYTTAAAPTADTALRQTVTDHVAGTTTTYGYNTQNELTCAATSATATCSSLGYTYGYDSDGNMTSSTYNATPTSYTYNAADESTTGSAAFNGAGDETASSAGTAFAYNNFDQTTTIGSNTYSYTGTGQNGLTVAAGTTLRNSSQLGVTALTTSGATTNITRDANGNLVTIRNSGSSYYYLLDATNSVIDIINSSGTSQGTYSYNPYGELTNTPASGIATTNPFRYNSGYQTANGVYHYGARYYNANVARWTQLDPTGQNPGYNYAGDSPVNNNDPSGNGWFSDVVGGVTGLLTAGAVGVITFGITGNAFAAGAAAGCAGGAVGTLTATGSFTDGGIACPVGALASLSPEF